MTKETLNKANQIQEQIRDLNRIVSEFKEVNLEKEFKNL